jgi:hypothetical protein
MRHDLTLMQVRGVMLNLADAFGDDEQLKIDMLEGETDLLDQVRRLLNGIETDEGDKAALKSQIEDRKSRMDRCDHRIEARREAILALMQCAELDKLPLPEATVSVRTVAASIKVNDPQAVPEEYTVPAPKPDLAKIKEAFAPATEGLPNWLRVEPERPSLTIRRK